MLNLSCEYSSKTFSVKFDDSLTPDCNIHGVSAKDAMGMVRALQEAASKNSGKNIFDQKFDLVVRDVKLVERLRGLLKTVRSANSSSKIASNLKDEMSEFVTGLFYRNKERDNFSLPEQYVLNKISCHLYYSPTTCDIIDLYDASKRDRSKILEKKEELLNYPYGKYTYDYEEIIEAIEKRFSECFDKIDGFELVLDTAGEDLINWSQHKISRFLNESKKGLNYYSIGEWINNAKESLRASGVKPKTKKKGVTRREVLEKKFNKDPSSVTQDELVTLFKQTNLNGLVLNLMEYPTLVELMQSKLMVVSNKIYSQWRGLDSLGLTILYRACELAPKTMEDFKIIHEYASRNKTDLSWEYLYTVQDFLTTDFVLDVASRNKTMGEITPEFYEKFLSDLPAKKLLDINNSITFEFVSRLGVEDKIGLLPRLLSDFIRKADTNSVNFLLRQEWFDDIDRVCFTKEHLFKLYKEVPWDKIKEKVLTSASFQAVDFILENNDVESANFLLTSGYNKNLNSEGKIKLAKMFDEETQLQLVLENPDTFKNCVIELIEDESRLVKIFQTFFGDKDCHGYAPLIARHFTYLKLDTNKLKEAILQKKEHSYLTLDSSLMCLLDKKVKTHILKSGDILEPNDSGHYSVRSNGYDFHLMAFFKDFTRDELVKLLGNLSECRYTLYLAHAMIIEERIEIAERDLLFTRINLEFLPYEYLKKFENKKLFKSLVGDRRNSTNDHFARRLEKRLQDKLNPSNTIKMLYS